MKILKTVFVLIFTTVLLAFTASGEEVPKKVKDAFSKKFPTAKSVSWDKESKTEWEAEFKMYNIKYSANFMEDGSWKETEHKIDKNEIPQPVLSGLMNAFKGYKIEGAEISETAKGIVYEFEIEKGKQEMEVVMDASGKIIKKENKSEDEEDEDED